MSLRRLPNAVLLGGGVLVLAAFVSQCAPSAPKGRQERAAATSDAAVAAMKTYVAPGDLDAEEGSVTELSLGGAGFAGHGWGRKIRGDPARWQAGAPKKNRVAVDLAHRALLRGRCDAIDWSALTFDRFRTGALLHETAVL